MPFGIRSAQEVYQKRISQIFENLEGVETDIDDIIIWGQTEEEHDRRLQTVLRKCEDTGKLMFVPDMLSRAYIKDDKDNISDDIECFINMVIKSMPVSDKKIEEIKDETEKDDKLSIVRKYIREGWPEHTTYPIKLMNFGTVKMNLRNTKESF
ncbi:unnamed protein product [Mytilus coruscus]|uniref:Reverse transcriptase domain-containing protein n=1 Tax=Mytilus coruscus TaxID=42192 RepID=A0A6J8BE60_MYTCO|nr:unnamed protein product [Mytilus coruscus]